MVKNSVNIDNSNKDIKVFIQYVSSSKSDQKTINDFLNDTKCEIVHIESTKDYILIFYKEIK